MLHTLRNLALLELNRRFHAQAHDLATLRGDHGAEIGALLVESGERIPRVYLLQADPHQQGLVHMWSEEVTPEKAGRLPFNKPAGSQSGALGPVLKRSFKPATTPPHGPSPKILETTRKDFLVLATGETPWAAYFEEVVAVLFEASELEYAGKVHPVGERGPYGNILEAAVALIPEKETVFLSVVDDQGRWPGDRDDYRAYLTHILAQAKYTTAQAPAHEDGTCPLCGAAPVPVYPNALKGAGINFANMDREGAFPGVNLAQSWKAYALCLDCADLLYIFKFHLLDQFKGRVAGTSALLLPSLLGNPEGQDQFMEDWADYIRGLEGDHVRDLEEDLMEFFAGRDDAHLLLNILWASFGQNIDDCRGYVTDILPSRLQELIVLNRQAKAWSHPLAPRHPLREADPDLSLSSLYPLFHRPGGKAAQKANDSPQLFALKRDLAHALYHGSPLAEPAALWGELRITARWRLREAAATGKPWGLIREGVNKKQEAYWTLAGWVRHLARFLYYLHLTGALPMTEEPIAFEPRMKALQPYLASGSGIDSPEKAFAFLLGILYGKLLQVQGARGVNVTANALTWLKRLNLAGRDLPELYIKIREKLLSYGTESSCQVRDLLHDIGRLGAMLGDRIPLDNTATCYFLLLGQSVTGDVLPSKEGDEEA